MKEVPVTRMSLSLVKTELKKMEDDATEQSRCHRKASGTSRAPAGADSTNGICIRFAEAEWIFSRGQRLLLEATETTSEMPGGMVRLIHAIEYTTVDSNVKKQGLRE
jgi:hypothetical protein